MTGLGFRVDGLGFSLGFRVLNVRFTSHGSKDYLGTLQCSRSIRSIDVAVAASATADAVKDLVPGLTAAPWQSVYSSGLAPKTLGKILAYRVPY